jgi:hypothetical protein
MFRYLIAGLALFASPASAGDSLYSDLDLKKCQSLSNPGDEENCCKWRCKGMKGQEFLVWEGDLRSFVAYGAQAQQQCAALQTLSAFNTLGPKVEWRVDGAEPYATILRWFTDVDGVKKNWLVVTKLDGAQGCHVAYVDGGLKDANVIARRFADDVAPRFACETGLPAVQSKQPMTPDEIASGAPCGPGPYREEE